MALQLIKNSYWRIKMPCGGILLCRTRASGQAILAHSCIRQYYVIMHIGGRNIEVRWATGSLTAVSGKIYQVLNVCMLVSLSRGIVPRHPSEAAALHH